MARKRASLSPGPSLACFGTVRSLAFCLGRAGCLLRAGLLDPFPPGHPLPPVPAAHCHSIVLDVLAQSLQVRQCLLERAIGKQNAELLAAVAVRRASALDRREAGGDELEHLVADMVAVCVVEQLEIVDVYHA